MKEKFVIVFGIFDTTARELVYFLSSPFFLLNGTPKSFSDSVSPAFLIRVGAAMEYSGSEEEVEEAKENIYEEIREKAEDNQLHNQQNQTDSQPYLLVEILTNANSKCKLVGSKNVII